MNRSWALRPVLAAVLPGELLKWGDALSVMQRVRSKVKLVWVWADEHGLGSTDSFPASWRKWPRLTKWCSFWLDKSNTSGVLCYLGSKSPGAYTLGDRSQHHPPLIPASRCHTGGPCYAQLPSEGIDRARVLTGGNSQHTGQIWPKHTQSRVCSVVILQLPILHFRPCWANWVLWKEQAIGRLGPMHVWISTNISSVSFLSVSLLYRCPFTPVHFLMWIWVWTGSLHEYMERSPTIHPSVTE